VTLYAIRHKATGNYLSQYRRGTSYWNGEPDERNAPRLLNLRGAKSLVIQWAYGEHRNTVHETANPITGYDCWVDHEIIDKGRKRTDLEIIPVTLTFGEPL